LSLHSFQSRKHEQKEALRLIGAKLSLLKELNYIEGNSLTPKGQFAKTVYGYELILSELYAENILENLDEFGLGILAAAIVFEPRKKQHLPGISKASRKIKRACEEIHDKIKRKEARLRIYSFSKQPYFHLSTCIESWLRGTKFDKILQCTDTDEGEVVRYFRMSIQILREINDAPVVSYVLKDKIKETIRVLNRDIVDAQRQLEL
jgi:superfamily II RNA helicase